MPGNIPVLVRTMVVRFGRDLPIDWKVLRPITSTWPMVLDLNHLKSSGRCQGKREPSPITRLRDIAAIAWRPGMGFGIEEKIRGRNRTLKFGFSSLDSRDFLQSSAK